MSSDEDRTERKRRKKEKKAKKEKRPKEKAPKLHQMVGYTNSDNPFGDHNLHQQFTWKKKAEKAGGDAAAPVSAREKRERDQHFYEEIQKVRGRRSDREAEMEEQERLRAEEARLREAEQYSDWHAKEESFHLEQARVRSKIRLVEGREKPIDLLAKNIILLSNDGEEEERTSKKTADTASLEVELREPHTIFDGLDKEELTELLEDIRTYQDLEGEGSNREFWKALEVVCRSEIDSASSSSSSSSGAGSGDTGVHSSVMEELTSTFAGKSSEELEGVRFDIQSKLDGGGGGNNDDGSGGGHLDVEFWESVLVKLTVHRAKADVKGFHQKMLKQWLEVIERKKQELVDYRLEHPEEVRAEQEAADQAKAAVMAAAEAEAAKAAASGGAGAEDTSAQASAMVKAEAARGLADLEEEMGLSDEVKLSTQGQYWWQDKWRPRKPRYFNRVRTGYEWNKYNQTHYDHDNPPPKTVQGYKFSIFYPDLIDRTVTPKYVCEPADSPQFMILRFTAGAPYEDVAFKLVRKKEKERDARLFGLKKRRCFCFLMY
jgi:hypothetical protein